MVQLNLLPDVKEKYIKALKLRRLVFGISGLVIIGSIVVVGILFGVANGALKLQLDNQQEDINKYSKELTSIPDLNKILTIQNQLNSLGSLHNQKPASSRIYDFLPQIIPEGVNINRMSLNLEPGSESISIAGTARNQETTNKLVDTLKFTKYTVSGSEEQNNAFNSVVLTSFSMGEKGASYAVDFKYSPDLFSAQKADVKLIVPKQISTRSTTERPEDIFINTNNSEGQ